MRYNDLTIVNLGFLSQVSMNIEVAAYNLNASTTLKNDE
jgi:hypothetical protein